MNPSQILSLAFLFGLFPGYLAGSWCPWWLAGLPCYAAALLVHRVASADEESTPLGASAASTGVLVGSFAEALSVVMCRGQHASWTIDGLDPCAAALMVGLAYAVYVWRDELNPPAFPRDWRGVWLASLGLYVATIGFVFLLRGVAP